ncbi:hypothetical protein MBLNU459_g4428t1 [Dothideomycetes sp. NU459]
MQLKSNSQPSKAQIDDSALRKNPNLSLSQSAVSAIIITTAISTQEPPPPPLPPQAPASPRASPSPLFRTPSRRHRRQSDHSSAARTPAQTTPFLPARSLTIASTLPTAAAGLGARSPATSSLNGGSGAVTTVRNSCWPRPSGVSPARAVVTSTVPWWGKRGRQSRTADPVRRRRQMCDWLEVGKTGRGREDVLIEACRTAKSGSGGWTAAAEDSGRGSRSLSLLMMAVDLLRNLGTTVLELPCWLWC